MKAIRWALAVGAVAAVSVLSPLTVWFALVIVPIVYISTRGLDPDEQRWVIGLTVCAVALRAPTASRTDTRPGRGLPTIA